MATTPTCSLCADPNCTSRENELRKFQDWRDLATHTSEETIVRWVNAYAVKELRSKEYHKAYQERNKALARAATQFLDPDELAALKKRAEAIAARKLERDERE